MRADPVWDAEWDLLVVLDACRADLWAEVVDLDSPVPVGTTRISPGGTSTEWLDAVFKRPIEELSEIGYVTANPYSESHIENSALGYLHEVWRDGWDDKVGTVPPRAVTDAAIAAGRAQECDRLIVHYMQPHFPALGEDLTEKISLEEFGDRSLSVWEDLRFGRLSRADVWQAYKHNLEQVLEEVVLLLNNVDAETAVITSDHGNAIGERGIFGHAEGLALRPLREVPWAVTTATDSGEYTPDTPDEDSLSEHDVEERLAALGYR